MTHMLNCVNHTNCDIIPPYSAKEDVCLVRVCKKKIFTGKLKLTYSELFFSAEKHAGNLNIQINHTLRMCDVSRPRCPKVSKNSKI